MEKCNTSCHFIYKKIHTCSLHFNLEILACLNQALSYKQCLLMKIFTKDLTNEKLFK